MHTSQSKSGYSSGVMFAFYAQWLVIVGTSIGLLYAFCYYMDSPATPDELRSVSSCARGKFDEILQDFNRPAGKPLSHGTVRRVEGECEQEAEAAAEAEVQRKKLDKQRAALRL